MAANIEKLNYVAIQVWDLEKAMEFFHRTLGCEFWKIEQWSGGEEKFGPQWDINGTLDQFGMNIVAPESPEGNTARLLEKRGEGVASVMFKAGNYEQAKAELNKFGVRALSEPEQGPYTEVYHHPKDTCGVMLGLCKYAPAIHPQSTVVPKKLERKDGVTLSFREFES